MAEAQPRPASNGNTGTGEVLHSLTLPCPEPSTGSAGRVSLEGLISGAGAQITRLSAPEAFSASVADGLICDHGYSSILAASNLVQLGFYRAGDVIGGFEAWKDMRLPIEPCRYVLGSIDMLPGAGPPG